MPIFTAEELTEICFSVFRAMGVSDAEAELVAQSMVEANLAGHDSHGVIHLPKYVREIENGLIQPGAEIQVRRESPSMATLDGGWGFGPVIAVHAVKLAALKAKATDVATVTAYRCNEVGRLGGYALIAAKEDMIGLLTVNDHGGGQCVAPYGGVEGRLSTNPMACAIPVAGRDPILLDMSTSVVASGKLRVKRNRQEALPEGWIIDANGNPSINVADFYGTPPGLLLPFGGVAAHKGFGLSVVVDILSGALSGAGCSRAGETRVGNGLFVTVINIASFTDLSAFHAEVNRFIGYVKSTKRLPGVEEILMPGERGFREERGRRQEGVFIDENIWAEIQAVVEKYRVKQRRLSSFYTTPDCCNC
jgi:uncharacterized oxidoreductase